MLISVCMIVRDEEPVLEEALISIPRSFEIIVIDTGSKDHTTEIAAKYGAKISHASWNNDFSSARNVSLEKAQGEYILVMDADERLAQDIESQIGRFIARFPHNAGSVLIENVVGSDLYKHRMVRFIPNDSAYRFNGSVHETLYMHGAPAPFEHSDIRITHIGYQKELYEQRGKLQRYEQLYLQQLAELPDNGYLLYQIGKLYFSVQDYQKALPYLEKSMECKEYNHFYYPVMLVMLGYTLKYLGRSKNAENLLIPFVTLYPQFPDLPFLLGLLCMDTGNFKGIEEFFLTALNIGESDKYTSVEGTGSYRAQHNLGVYYEITGNRDKCLTYYTLAAESGFAPSHERLSKILSNGI